ncbi:MAG: roadblock/LC7 domain-containing protein [Promethearchaeota archaeon]
MSTARLNEILKQLINSGFKACIFSLKDGLPLASMNSEGVNEKMVAAMSAMLADTAERAKQDLNLSDMEYIKIMYKDSCILCKNIIVGDTSYLLAALVDRPETDEVDKYNEQLMEWAYENGRPILEKLGSL